MKALFWPTTAHDSIAGYDYFAKVVAAEGKLDNSIYDPLNYTHSYRTLYPPLIPIAFAFVYLCGLVSSKIIVSIYFVSILITFYGFLRYFSTHLNAIFFTLLMAVIPEFLAMSALSLTNVPSVVYTTTGVVSLVLCFREMHFGYLYLSAIMMGFAVFTRTETIVFAAAGGVLLLIKAIPLKKWSGIYASIPLLFFAGWELYLKYVWALTGEKQPFMYKIFWDGERLSKLWNLVMDVSFDTFKYGLTVYIFVIASL